MIGQLAIRTKDGPRYVASLSGGGIPKGIALCLVPFTQEPHSEALWSVTHVESGTRLGPGWVLLPDARHAAEALADVCDWTTPWRVLVDDADVRDRTAKALEAYAAEPGARA